MEDKVKDGGAAFPMPASPENYSQDGMTLRDWFAGQALAGMLCKAVHEDFDILAANSYAAADAMLAAREPGQ